MTMMLATAAVFSCVEFHTLVANVMSVEMSAKVKAEIITELANATEHGCEMGDGDVDTTP